MVNIDSVCVLPMVKWTKYGKKIHNFVLIHTVYILHSFFSADCRSTAEKKKGKRREKIATSSRTNNIVTSMQYKYNKRFQWLCFFIINFCWLHPLLLLLLVLALVLKLMESERVSGKSLSYAYFSSHFLLFAAFKLFYFFFFPLRSSFLPISVSLYLSLSISVSLGCIPHLKIDSRDTKNLQRRICCFACVMKATQFNGIATELNSVLVMLSRIRKWASTYILHLHLLLSVSFSLPLKCDRFAHSE